MATVSVYPWFDRYDTRCMFGPISNEVYLIPGPCSVGGTACDAPFTSLNTTVPSGLKACSYVLPAVGPSLKVHLNVRPESGFVCSGITTSVELDSTLSGPVTAATNVRFRG